MKLIRFSFKYILKHYLAFIILVLFATIRAAITIVLPYISGSFIDQLLANTNAKTIYTYAGRFTPDEKEAWDIQCSACFS